MEKCADPATVWHMHRTVCHKTVAQRAASFLHSEEYKDEPYHDGSFAKWSKEQSEDFPSHYLDGVTIWVADHPQHEPNDDAEAEVVDDGNSP